MEAEAIAAQASSESGLDDRPHADPLVLAAAYLQLRLMPRRGRCSRLLDGVIVYPAHADEQARAYFVAHECGHFLVRDVGLRVAEHEEEMLASRIGCALILPRRAFLRDARRCDEDVDQLRALWPLATAKIIRRRLAELRD